jgi:hypothetical protein
VAVQFVEWNNDVEQRDIPFLGGGLPMRVSQETELSNFTGLWVGSKERAISPHTLVLKEYKCCRNINVERK